MLCECQVSHKNQLSNAETTGSYFNYGNMVYQLLLMRKYDSYFYDTVRHFIKEF